MLDRRDLLKTLGNLGLMAAAAPVLASDTPPPAAAAAASGEEALEALELKARQSLGAAGNCAQTSFAVLQEHFGLPGDGFHLALSPFPGIGFRGETCGAVVGSMMALGLVLGYTKDDDPARRRSTYLQAQELCRRFEGRVGSTKCRDIQAAKAGRWFNLLDPAEARAYGEAGGAEACRGAVGAGVRIAAELILASGKMA